MAPKKPSPLDVRAIAELARRHPKELDQLRRQFAEVDHEDESVAAFLDRYGRRVDVGSKVVTGRGEIGRIKRIDVASRRALIELEQGGTRMLRTNKLELKRGRPRRDSFQVASVTAGVA